MELVPAPGQPRGKNQESLDLPKVVSAKQGPLLKKPAGQRQCGVVLVASADPEERALWSRTLGDAGHSVLEAPTALLLLEFAQQHHPDIILCSLDSPELDAFSLLGDIRNDARTATLPCLLASHDPADWRRAMTRGADDFLTAPFPDADLLDAVEARLHRQRLAADTYARAAFEVFPTELLELVVRKTPVAKILGRIATQVRDGIGAIGVIPRFCCHGEQLETVQAEGLNPRNWAELDGLIAQLLESSEYTNPGRKEFVIGLNSALFGFFASQKIEIIPGRLWHVPVRNEDGKLLGSFEVLLPLVTAGALNLNARNFSSEDPIEADRWLSGTRRASLDPIFRLAGVLMERQHLFEELTRQTHFDSVTSLPNRKEFERHLREAYRRGEESGAVFAILCLDIDRFQRINDTYGYDVADQILVDFSARLRQQSRGRDLVARISGDEFAILIPDAFDLDAIKRLASRLIEVVSAPYMVKQHQIMIGATAGISRYPEDGSQPADLLANAEAAMVAARRSNRGHVAVFKGKQEIQTIDGVEIESYLERALAVDGFQLHYQPLFRAGGTCSGYEALIRLRHGLARKSEPGTELVSPGIFLPTAEDSGLIVPIGMWVFEEACRQLQRWNRIGFPSPRVAVNLSARQLSQPDLVPSFESLASRYGVAPASIELELTESAAIADFQSGRRRLEELNQIGFKISIDDFGTGYSSLSNISNLPASKIKIDQSFVSRLAPGVTGRRDPNRSVIEAILVLSNNLGTQIVAEGVETPEQCRILTELGCHELQGFLFSRPLPVDKLEQFMETHKAWTTDWFAAAHEKSA
jgi:diguanylate cyclase (GGDEF)-like protein